MAASEIITPPSYAQPERRFSTRTSTLTPMKFSAAAVLWLEYKRMFIEARTILDYGHYLRRLSRTFGNVELSDISIEHLRAYQMERYNEGVGAVAINHELGVLVQIMKHNVMWNDRLRQLYKKLPLDRSRGLGPGVALTHEQNQHFFETVLSRVEGANDGRRDYWDVALWASILSINTSAGPGEIRNLQLRDINLTEVPPRIYIRKGKNKYRIRETPLNATAELAVRKLLEVAHKKGCKLPEHFLLPARRSGRAPHAQFNPVPVVPPPGPRWTNGGRHDIKKPLSEHKRSSGGLKQIDLVAVEKLRAQKVPWRVIAEQVGLSEVNLRRRMLGRKAGDEKYSYDPTKPQGSWRNAWDGMRKAAELPDLRRYDLRHTTITWLLANRELSERVVIETVGHVDNNMLARYSHQRFSDKAKALATLAPAFDFMMKRQLKP
jgi:integrase